MRHSTIATRDQVGNPAAAFARPNNGPGGILHITSEYPPVHLEVSGRQSPVSHTRSPRWARTLARRLGGRGHGVERAVEWEKLSATPLASSRSRRTGASRRLPRRPAQGGRCDVQPGRAAAHGAVTAIPVRRRPSGIRLRRRGTDAVVSTAVSRPAAGRRTDERGLLNRIGAVLPRPHDARARVFVPRRAVRS
jgi:hypothetical protein